MGTTYEPILVAAPLDAVEAAVPAAGRDAIVRQIAAERILVDTEDRPRGLAMEITERTGRPAFTRWRARVVEGGPGNGRGRSRPCRT